MGHAPQGLYRKTQIQIFGKNCSSYKKTQNLKKNCYRLKGQSPQAGQISRAIRGDPHQILVENLDVERKLETPRLKDNIKTDLR
jgi:hypothetical protein